MTASVDRSRPAMSRRRSRPARVPGPRAARPLVRLHCQPGRAEPTIYWVQGLRPRHWLAEAELNGYLPGAGEPITGPAVPAGIAVATEGETPTVLAPVEELPVVAARTEAEAVEIGTAPKPIGTEPIETVAKPLKAVPTRPVPTRAEPLKTEPLKTEPLKTVPDEDAAVARARTELEEQSPPWLLIGLAVSVVAIVVAGTVIVRAGTGHSGPAVAARTSAISQGATPAAAGTAQAARAVAWLIDALDRDSTLVTDAPTRAALLAQGRAADTVFAAGQPPPATNFVVSTRQLRDSAAAGQDPAVARLLAGSRPVAQFGTGADSIQVRQVIPAGSIQVRQVIPAGARPDVLAASRTMAGQALLSNKALSVVPEAATLLAQGRLDLRAATLLAALAAQTPVRLIGLAQQQVEAGAGAPIRTIQLDLGESAALLGEYLDALPLDYRPASSQRQSDGSYVIQWHPDLAMVPPVS